ncbi:hypothetical protein ACLI09_09980 [Flavobacterium sp. RHBU_24]|uniref:hypothetical protein n=1 Tax=Flavobacterium sp. RHBU_24 TaxID=3391185 RepID=UPI00398508DE
MTENWDEEIEQFVLYANQEQVRMLMVGGGAVNFHGYQRHSADVDFWIEPTLENFAKLVSVFNRIGFDIADCSKSISGKFLQ